jgi:hypothetical protein
MAEKRAEAGGAGHALLCARWGGESEVLRNRLPVRPSELRLARELRHRLGGKLVTEFLYSYDRVNPSYVGSPDKAGR